LAALAAWAATQRLARLHDSPRIVERADDHEAVNHV
jgi:hypothetical protein